MAMWGQDASEKLGRFHREPVDPVPQDPPPKPRFRHDIPLQAAAVSVDRRILIALDAEGYVIGWDALTAKRRYRRPALGKGEAPQRLTFSPDGRFVVLSPRSLPSGLVRVLDPAGGHELRRFDRGFGPSFSPDGELLACSDGKNLRRWAIKSGAELPNFPEAEAPLKWTAWSPTNDLIAASGEDSSHVALWDVATRQRMFRALVGSGWVAVASLAFSPDGKALAVGSLYGIRFCPLAGPADRPYHGHEEYANGQLKFSADGRRMIALSRRRRLLVWETFTSKQLFTWASYELEDGSLEVSEGGDVAIWIERGGIRLERIPVLLGGYEDGHVIRNLCVTPAGHVVTGDDRGAVRVWDPATQKEIRRHSVPLQRMRSFSHDGAWAVFGGAGDPVGIWDLEAGREILKVEVTPAVQSIALSPDDRRMALGHSDGSITLWSITERKELTRIRTEMASVTAISWSSDGKSLAWGDQLGVVMIAEGEKGLEQTRFRSRGGAAVHELRFSADRRTVVTTDAGGLQRAYSDPGIEPKIVNGTVPVVPHVRLPDDRWRASGYSQKRSQLEIVREAISPDGSFIAGVTSAGKLVIWEAPGGR